MNREPRYVTEYRGWSEVEYVVRGTYIQQLLPTLEPTLATLILQWERGQRQIDHIVLHSHSVSGDNMVDWDKLTTKVAELAGNLARGKADAVVLGDDPKSWLIRRRRWSNEGLLIAVRPKLIVLATCDYRFRRTSTTSDWDAYHDAVVLADGPLRPRRFETYYDNGNNLRVATIGEMERLSHKRVFEAGVKQFIDESPFCSIPKRELAIHHFLATPGALATRFLMAPEFGLDWAHNAVDDVVKYYAQNQYEKKH
ncbi:unnamed protein product, partial [Mesorhabditis spiculigera]